MSNALSRALKIFKDDDGCFKGTALAVCLVDQNGDPVDPGAGGGGGIGDLEVVCDKVTGEQIFIKLTTDEDGNCIFTNPATGDVLTPGVDFCPCPDKTGDLITAIETLIECMCGDCPEGGIEDICATLEG